MIRVNSDVADELHVHSNPEHSFDVEATARPVVPVHRRRARPGRRRAARAGQDGRHHPGASDRGSAGHRAGARPRRVHRSADPVHVRAASAPRGRSRSRSPSSRSRGGQPRFDPDKPGRALPQWVTAAVDAPRHPVGGRGGRAAAHRLGGGRRLPRAAERREPAARRVLRAAVGRPGRGVAAARPGLAGDLPGAHGAPRCAGGRTLGAAVSRRRWGTGPPRSGCSRSCGSSWPAPIPARSARSGPGC